MSDIYKIFSKHNQNIWTVSGMRISWLRILVTAITVDKSLYMLFI